jgi:hypothetical protein
MTVTLHAIDIETIMSIRRIMKPKINSFALGGHALQLTQHVKNMLFQYQVKGIWSGGDSDYDSKESKVANIVDSGLPVWFDASSWRKNAMLFGKVHDFDCQEDEGAVNVTSFSFLITGVFPWGYTFIQDDGNGDFRIYDTDKHVQSRTLNPILRNCGFAKTASQISYSFYVKNVGSVSGAVVIEIMVPDAVTSGSVSTNVTTTKNHGDVGGAGISSSPGTKRRITLTRTLAGGVEELWTVTISTAGIFKTSFLDGSIDDTAA